MGATAVQPKLYIVRQESEIDSGNFHKKYEAITDHLIDVIRTDGKLDLQVSSVKQSEFTETAHQIRNKVDSGDRPFAFLFLRPNPTEETVNNTIYDSVEAIDVSTQNAKTTDPDPALASSFLFFSEKTTEATSSAKYQDHMPIFKGIDIDSDELFENVAAQWLNFTHLPLTDNKLKNKLTKYGTDLVNHVLAMHKAQDSAKGLIELKGNQSAEDLTKEQQKAIWFIDWDKVLEQEPDDQRYKIMHALVTGSNLDSIQAQLELDRIQQVNQVLNAFLDDQDKFFEGLNLDKL